MDPKMHKNYHFDLKNALICMKLHTKNKIFNFFSYISAVWLLSYYENRLNKPKMPKNNPVTALFERMVDGRMLKFGMPLPKTHF